MTKLPRMDPDQRRSLYTDMVRLRLVEEAIAAQYTEREMRCPVHLSVGQEAIATGTCAALKPGDVAVSTHRCHAHYLAKGGDLKAMMAEIYGKATGCCGGRGGSMSLFDADAGLMASVPIVGSSIALGVGMALSIKQREESQVSVVFLGDASIEEGVFHESANFAAVQQLPVLFICENNFFSVYTSLPDRQPDRPMTDVAKAYAMPARQVDGNDVETVYDTVGEAAARARDGSGPSFLVFDTYRWREHCGPFYDNDIGYRSEDEFEQWKKKCPVGTYRKALEKDSHWDAEREQMLIETLNVEIQEAFQFAKDSPFPETSTAGDFVYG